MEQDEEATWRALIEVREAARKACNKACKPTHPLCPVTDKVLYCVFRTGRFCASQDKLRSCVGN